MDTTTNNAQFLSRQELGDRYGLAPKTIAAWASKGLGPPYYVIGGTARYRLDDVMAWEAQQLRTPASKTACRAADPPLPSGEIPTVALSAASQTPTASPDSASPPGDSSRAAGQSTATSTGLVAGCTPGDSGRHSMDPPTCASTSNRTQHDPQDAHPGAGPTSAAQLGIWGEEIG